MVGKVPGAEPTAPFEYVLFEGDPDHLRTVVAASSQMTPWIEPEKLKLRHRIGRGPFGDVWLATQHQSNENYEEYHEVAVKMLPPIKEDNMRDVLNRLDNVFTSCQGIQGVCWIQGISVINGRICIITKFYEGSIGDKLARMKEGKLPISDVLRYGITLAKGILALHAKEILVLNLKPCNFLLDDDDQVVLGDAGIPYLLHGIPFPSSDMTHQLGTPNYMAPEQWQPEVRGPISFETDSWGFGCSIVEMLTGFQPWMGMSIHEIHQSVVRKHEKPMIPSSLPPPLENVLLGCFEYDFRSRPSMTDILQAFESTRGGDYGEAGWRGGRLAPTRSVFLGYTEWFLSKDHLKVGDMVRSRKPLNSNKPENMDICEGMVVGLENSAEGEDFVLVRVPRIHDPVRVRVPSLERVSHGLAAGDWVRLKAEDKRHSPVGILHSINRNGNVAVGFIGIDTLWKGSCSDLQMAESYSVGLFVRLKANVLSPRFDWPRKRNGTWATGRIGWILPNGCLEVNFPGLLTFGNEANSFLADPAEVEVVMFNTCPGIAKKYQHLEDFHWSVRPVVIAVGLFTAMKFGSFVIAKMGRSKARRSQRGEAEIDGHQHTEGTVAGNPGWLPPKVANIIFREGVSISAA